MKTATYTIKIYPVSPAGPIPAPTEVKVTRPYGTLTRDEVRSLLEEHAHGFAYRCLVEPHPVGPRGGVLPYDYSVCAMFLWTEGPFDVSNPVVAAGVAAEAEWKARSAAAAKCDASPTGVHVWKVLRSGNCYHESTCVHCNKFEAVDSSD